MGTSTDPPLITFDPAPDAAERLRRLSHLLLGNNTAPSVVTTEDGDAYTPRTTENDNAPELYYH